MIILGVEAMSDINLLMQRMDEINAKSAEAFIPEDISIVIAYHRNQRARRAAGEKTVKPREKSTINLAEILGHLNPKPATQAVFKRKL